MKNTKNEIKESCLDLWTLVCLLPCLLLTSVEASRHANIHLWWSPQSLLVYTVAVAVGFSCGTFCFMSQGDHVSQFSIPKASAPDTKCSWVRDPGKTTDGQDRWYFRLSVLFLPWQPWVLRRKSCSQTSLTMQPPSAGRHPLPRWRASGLPTCLWQEVGT